MIGTFCAGLFAGLVFSYIMKRSRLCPVGLIRDGFLEKRCDHIRTLCILIFSYGFLYHTFVFVGWIRGNSYLPPFSAPAVALGGLLFGFGATLSGGCLAMVLQKCGDGRIVGIAALSAFILSGYLFSAGPLYRVTYRMQSVLLLRDVLIDSHTFFPAAVCLLGLLIFWYFHRRQEKRTAPICPPARFKGARHVLFEKRWPASTGALFAGTWLGISQWISEANGRHFGPSLATPILSFAYSLTSPKVIVGSCNIYDQKFGWASMFVIGMIIGSFVTSYAAKEFVVVIPDRKTMIRSLAGGALMGIGAVLGQGCMLSSGIIGAGQFTRKGWFALLFIAAGVVASAEIFFREKITWKRR